MEKDTFLSQLSENEVKILCAAAEITKKRSKIDSAELKRHDLVLNMKPATFHRALKSLVEKEFIEFFEGAKAKRYLITDRAKS